MDFNTDARELQSACRVSLARAMSEDVASRLKPAQIWLAISTHQPKLVANSESAGRGVASSRTVINSWPSFFGIPI